MPILNFKPIANQSLSTTSSPTFESITETNPLTRSLKGGWFFDDFANYYSNITTSNTNFGVCCNTFISGAGATISTTSADPNHPGIPDLSTGTTTSGTVILMSKIGAMVYSNISFIFETMIRPSHLSTSAQKFEIYAGLSAYPDSDPTFRSDVFHYSNDDVNATPNIYIKEYKSYVSTISEDSGVAMTVNYFKLKIIIYNDNTMDFFINDVKIGATKNFLSGVAVKYLVPFVGIYKLAGTTSRSLRLDYIYGKYEYLTTPSRA